MNRPRRLFASTALLFAISACSQAAGSIEPAPAASQTAVPSIVTASPGPTASPTASPTGTPSPAQPTSDPATVLAANGIGPYEVGGLLSELQSEGLVVNLAPSFNCDDEWQSAEATGRYADRLTVTFLLGRLIDVHTASAELVTPSGARVGMPLAELQGIYGSRGGLITGVSGNQAVSVHEPNTDLGIVFYLDEANATVRAISAGGVERLETAALVGEGC